LLKFSRLAKRNKPISSLLAVFNATGGFRYHKESGGTMTTRLHDSIVEILLVEDDCDDVELVREALQDGPVTCCLNVVSDGVEAMSYLRGEGPYIGSLLPDLILLDLKMPKKGGLEVLAEVKADPTLRPIPVILLTTSDAPQDILKAYDLQANCYVTKPSDLDEFHRVMNTIRDFCLTVVKLPPRDQELVAQVSRA
jgi:chemotaxis family two-component system response regulator Rcp1